MQKQYNQLEQCNQKSAVIKLKSGRLLARQEIKHSKVHGVMRKPIPVANGRAVRRRQVRLSIFQIFGHKSIQILIVFQCNN